MNLQLLDIDVQLLILRYGRPKVLQALARLGKQTVEDLEHQLRAAAQKPKAKRPNPPATDLLASVCQERPEITEFLRELAVRFDNRTVLPHLRDVQRFLDRIDPPPRKLKSRAAAAPLLMRALAKLTPEELSRLFFTDESADESDYSLLVRAIMKSPATNQAVKWVSRASSGTPSITRPESAKPRRKTGSAGSGN